MTNQPLAVVIEDDPFLSEIYADSLRSIGMRAEILYDGESAMNQLDQLKPDLIILDLNLPKFTGIEVLHALRKNPETAETWVVIVTANPSQAAEIDVSEMDAQNLLVLTKPVSVEQLDQLAQRLVFRNRP